jgi:hypothetical protein
MNKNHNLEVWDYVISNTNPQQRMCLVEIIDDNGRCVWEFRNKKRNEWFALSLLTKVPKDRVVKAFRITSGHFPE